MTLSDTSQRTGDSATMLKDVPFGSRAKLTIERRGQIVLLGINRPYIQNRIDPETFEQLADAYYQYDHDPRSVLPFSSGTGRASREGSTSTDSSRLQERESLGSRAPGR